MYLFPPPPPQKKNDPCLNKRIDVIVKASAYLFKHFRKELALQQDFKEWHAAAFGAFFGVRGEGGGGGGGGISRIYSFCSLIFMPFVTEIQLNKLRAHFCARFAPMVWSNCDPLDAWGGGDYNIGTNRAGKRGRSLFKLYLRNG